MNKAQQAFIEAYYTRRVGIGAKVNLSLGDLKYFASEYTKIDPTPEQDLYRIMFKANTDLFPEWVVNSDQTFTKDQAHEQLTKYIQNVSDIIFYEAGTYLKVKLSWTKDLIHEFRIEKV